MFHKFKVKEKSLAPTRNVRGNIDCEKEGDDHSSDCSNSNYADRIRDFFKKTLLRFSHSFGLMHLLVFTSGDGNLDLLHIVAV